MAVDFVVKNIIHRIAVKFVNAQLPNAKKAYHLKAVHQPEIDIHGIASKAALYDISTSPHVIEEGLKAGIMLMYHLAADGYKIKTPLFNLRIRIPGEYEGTEDTLPTGVRPVPRLQINRAFRKFMDENVKIEFAGMDADTSFISKATDNVTNHGWLMTKGNIITINGRGLKISGDGNHKDQAGIYFVPKDGVPVKASTVVVNTHKILKVLVPTELTETASYQLVVKTQSSTRNNGGLLNHFREIRSDFTLTANEQ
jgi:hypothetical protein